MTLALGLVTPFHVLGMRSNRSIPETTVIPELAYADLAAAVRWLCDAFGFQERARAARAEILSSPTTYPFGERQYSVRDPGGHRWTFSETVDDVDPATWGGILNPDR